MDALHCLETLPLLGRGPYVVEACFIASFASEVPTGANTIQRGKWMPFTAWKHRHCWVGDPMLLRLASLLLLPLKYLQGPIQFKEDLA
jgi:hypothetical protein